MSAQAHCIESFKLQLWEGEPKKSTEISLSWDDRVGSSRRLWWVEFTGQNTGEERATQREKRGPPAQAFTWELGSAAMWENYPRLGEESPEKKQVEHS